MTSSSGKFRVLILEDEKWFLDALRDILATDFSLKFATSPEDIFPIIDSWWPDVILADIILGRKNLFVLLQEMQSYDDAREIPIVVLSSISQHISQENVVNLSIKKVFTKEDFVPENLIFELQKLAKESRGFSRKSGSRK